MWVGKKTFSWRTGIALLDCVANWATKWPNGMLLAGVT